MSGRFWSKISLQYITVTRSSVVGEVDDVVGIAWEHYNRLYAVAAHLIFKDFVGTFLAHL